MEYRVNLRGFLLIPRLPTASIFAARLAVVFRNVRIGSELIALLHGYFANKFNYINHRVYLSLRRFPSFRIWRVRCPVFLVSVSDVPVVRNVELDARREYDKFDRSVRRFLTEGVVPESYIEYLRKRKMDVDAVVERLLRYRESVIEYLRSRNVDVEKMIWSIPPLSSFVHFVLIPFNLSIDDVVKCIDEDAREWVKAKYRELAEQAIREVLSTLRQKLEEARKRLERTRSSSEILDDVREALREAEQRLRMLSPELARELVKVRLALSPEGLEDEIGKLFRHLDTVSLKLE